MIYFILFCLGLCLGSFINALVWRIHKQAEFNTVDGNLKTLSEVEQKELKKLSISKGRSMCFNCGHELAAKDLIPVISWVSLMGKCRYCKKPIADTPVPELLMGILTVLTFFIWPYAANGWDIIEVMAFTVWLMVLTGYVALLVYDAKWFLLPDRIVAPVTALTLILVVLIAIMQGSDIVVIWAVLGGLTISGIFYSLSYVSKGAWIGGGDIKLGVSIGMLAGTPLNAMLLIFLASLIATIIILPSIIAGKKNMTSHLPFGPFLIAAALITFFYGGTLFERYMNLLGQ